MKNTSRKPYIYKVTNFETGRYYIGSQCSGKKIGVNYFTSSTDKDFKEEFKNYRDEKYKIEIIKEFEDPDECGRAENYMIRDHMLLKDGLCLNRSCRCGNEKIFSTAGIHHSEKTKQKISLAKKGHPAWNKGQSPSEETRKRMSLAKKGFHPSEETRKKLSETHKGQSPWNKGIPPSEETKQKLSIAHKDQSPWNKGTHLSEETKQKIGLASKSRINISIGDNTFDSITEASKYHNVSAPTIRYWVKTKKHNAFYIEKCPKI